MKVGVCGMGRMGASIAERLIAVGHEVGVWNRDTTKTKPLVDAGAKAFASPAALAEGCDVTIVMLLNDAATEAVYRGPSGLLKAKLGDKLVIDMSTIRPDTMTSAGNAVTQAGAAFVECPVGGSKVPAKEGKLFGFVGGVDADVARAKPLLEQLCRRIEHVGPLGAGATLKLAVNLPLLVYWQAPFRHGRGAGCDERSRRRHRQGARRCAAWRDRLRHHRGQKGPRHRRAICRIPPCRTAGCEERAGLL